MATRAPFISRRRASTPARCVPTATRGPASCLPRVGIWWLPKSLFSMGTRISGWLRLP